MNNDTPPQGAALPKEPVIPSLPEKDTQPNVMNQQPMQESVGNNPQQNSSAPPPSQTTPPAGQPNNMNTGNVGAQNYTMVKTLLSWHAPDRIYHKKGREYYINIILIILIIEVLLFLFHQFTLMILIVTFGFLVFALAVMPPNTTRYRISSQGIALDESFFLWRELYDFYFTQREGQDVLHIRTAEYYPGEVVVHLGEMHKEQIISVLVQFLPYRESVQKTFMEKSGDWLSNTFPLDKLPSRS